MSPSAVTPSVGRSSRGLVFSRPPARRGSWVVAALLFRCLAPSISQLHKHLDTHQPSGPTAGSGAMRGIQLEGLPIGAQRFQAWRHRQGLPTASPPTAGRREFLMNAHMAWLRW